MAPSTPHKSATTKEPVTDRRRSSLSEAALKMAGSSDNVTPSSPKKSSKSSQKHKSSSNKLNANNERSCIELDDPSNHSRSSCRSVFSFIANRASIFGSRSSSNNDHSSSMLDDSSSHSHSSRRSISSSIASRVSLFGSSNGHSKKNSSSIELDPLECSKWAYSLSGRLVCVSRSLSRATPHTFRISRRAVLTLAAARFIRVVSFP